MKNTSVIPVLTILCLWGLQGCLASEPSVFGVIESGDAKALTSLVTAEPDLVNVKSPRDGQTPLHRAAFVGKADQVNVLLERGANVDTSDNSWGYTPLHLAAANGHREAVELLIAAGADVNAQSKAMVTPLHLAAYWSRTGVLDRSMLQSWRGIHAWGTPDLMKTLILAGADVNATTNLKETPLHRALIRNQGHVGAAGLLLEYGSDVHAVRSDGDKPIDVAPRSNEPLVDLLQSYQER